MPPARPPVPAGKGKGLGAKSVGGLPLWAVLGISAAVVYLGVRWYRGRTSAATATAPSPSQAPPTDVSGGASGGPAAGTDFSGLADAINGLTGVLGAGGTVFDASTTPPIPTFGDVNAPAFQAPSAIAPYKGPPPAIQGPPISQPAPAANAPAYQSPSNANTDAFGNVVVPLNGGGFVDPSVPGGVVVPASVAGAPITQTQSDAYIPPQGQIQSIYDTGPQVTPSPPVTQATNVLPQPTNQQIIQGQAASNAPPVVTTHGKAY